MSLYSCGILFTAGFIMTQEEEDTWRNAFISLFCILVFPFFWGLMVGDYLRRLKR